MGHARFVMTMAVASVGSAVVLSAQVPDVSMRFEAASVRQNTSRDARPNVDATPGRFTATAVTLRELIGIAYSVAGSLLRDEQIIGGPDWLDTDRFDIVATGGPTDPNIRPAPGAVSPREGPALNTMQAMLRQLLRDRFGLSTRSEQRDLPIYSLIRARPDRLGEQLRQFDGDCAKEANVEPNPAGAACGGFKFLGRGHLVARAVTIRMLVSMLANLPDVGRIVQDRTGLNGNFDLELSWTPAAVSREQSNTSPPVAPSLFTALDEQLGLELEPSRGPVEVLVIDAVERPTPN
jgi:uncharacterized protein (TIGR03435 family)